MKDNKSKYHFTTIILIYFIINLIKFDKDIFAHKEFINRSTQTYTEHLLPDNTSSFSSTVSVFYLYRVTTNNDIQDISGWNSLFILHNLHIHQSLKFNDFINFPTLKILAILHKKNISHKSSDEDEEPQYRFFA